MTKLKASLAAAAILAALPAAAQQAGTASGDIGAFADALAFRYADGKALYESSCQGCHQAGGVGAVGAGHYPALAYNANLESPGYPILLILNGQKAMPPLGGYFDDAQVAAIVNYIRSSFGNAWPADAVTARDVADLR